jgi:hypothetical protein
LAGEHHGARVTDVRERLVQLSDQLGVEGISPLRLRERHTQRRPVSVDLQSGHGRGP